MRYVVHVLTDHLDEQEGADYLRRILLPTAARIESVHAIIPITRESNQ